MCVSTTYPPPSSFPLAVTVAVAVALPAMPAAQGRPDPCGTPPHPARVRLAYPQTTTRTVMVTVRGGAAAARRAHNPKVVGSNPTPATKFFLSFE